MKIISGIGEMQNIANDLRRSGKRIGVVPTMGFLHEGHLSLIRVARQQADIVITTIFVNPTQFGPHEDFEKYPRNIERDTHLAESAGSDILFTPAVTDMYPDFYRTYVGVEKMTEVLEGKIRPTHFRGVTTIVAKLFNITQPDVAVFGQKDAQQSVVIRRMVSDLNFEINIIVAPIVREPDGLAMSSRNVYLSPAERKESTVLHRSLLHAKSCIEKGERQSSVIVAEMMKIISTSPLARVDYISIANPETLDEISLTKPGEAILVSLAVRFGATRLLDNALINIPK
jgi:pantoate--beta-alanine ligase